MKEKTQIHAIQNEKGEITTDPVEIQKIINNYFKNLYSHRFDNTEEMDRFLETYEPPKLDQEDVKLLNNPIYIN